MTLMLNLKPEDEAKLHALAAQEGSNAERVAQRMLEAKLAEETTSTEDRASDLSDEEFDAKLRAAGVRIGVREKNTDLPESWTGEDLAPEDSAGEWEQIQRNIETTRRWYEEPAQ